MFPEYRTGSIELMWQFRRILTPSSNILGTVVCGSYQVSLCYTIRYTRRGPKRFEVTLSAPKYCTRIVSLTNTPLANETNGLRSQETDQEERVSALRPMRAGWGRGSREFDGLTGSRSEGHRRACQSTGGGA